MERSSDENNKYAVGHKQQKLGHNILTVKYEPDKHISKSKSSNGVWDSHRYHNI
jgi:hypothetical protein